MKIYTLFFCTFFVSQLAAQPTADGLVCWFPFNGNADDTSPNGHNGAVSGALLTADRHGNPNSAYLFDGVDDFILVPDQPDLRLGSTSFTISAWVRPDAISDILSHTVISKRTGQGNLGYLFQLIGSAHVMGLGERTFDIITSGGWDDPKLTTYAQLSTQEWHHVLYCYDKETGLGQFFIDNLPDIIGQMIDANGDATGDFYIGKDKLTDGNEYPDIVPGYIGGFHFFGAIDDIRIYNRKLNTTEQTALFRETVNGTGPTAQKPNIAIFPDPVTDFMKVDTKGIDVQSFTIHDKAGRLFEKSNFNAEINCRYLPAGSFIISFFDNDERLIKAVKFIKS